MDFEIKAPQEDKSEINKDDQKVVDLSAFVNKLEDLEDDAVEAFVKSDEFKKSIKSVNKMGRGALFIASARGLQKATTILKDGGAQIDLRDKYNKTPLDVAQNKEISDILREVKK